MVVRGCFHLCCIMLFFNIPNLSTYFRFDVNCVLLKIYFYLTYKGIVKPGPASSVEERSLRKIQSEGTAV